MSSLECVYFVTAALCVHVCVSLSLSESVHIQSAHIIACADFHIKGGSVGVTI